MVENRPFLTVLSHLVVILGVIVIAFPVWMTFVASTHSQQTMLQSPIPLATLSAKRSFPGIGKINRIDRALRNGRCLRSHAEHSVYWSAVAMPS